MRDTGEKERARAGLLYDPNDPELVQERIDAKGLCFEYNMMHPAQVRERNELLNRLLGRTEGEFSILPPFYCDYGYNITIGKNFFLNHNAVILDCAPVTFGDSVFIGPNCGFYTAEHPINVSERNRGLEYAYPISVGNNVWIGGNVVLLAGVNIGEGSVIGAGSVVTNDIPKGVVAVGNPCRVLRPVTGNDLPEEEDT